MHHCVRSGWEYFKYKARATKLIVEMEQQLEQLVREQGFEKVFESLKTIVTREHERAKRDFDFLQSLMIKSAEEAKSQEKEKSQEETKTIEVSQPVKLARKIIRKHKSNE